MTATAGMLPTVGLAWHWLTATTGGNFVLGVVGNLVAAGLGYVLVLRKVWRDHIKPHLERTREIHERLLPELHRKKV